MRALIHQGARRQRRCSSLAKQVLRNFKLEVVLLLAKLVRELAFDHGTEATSKLVAAAARTPHPTWRLLGWGWLRLGCSMHWWLKRWWLKRCSSRGRVARHHAWLCCASSSRCSCLGCLKIPRRVLELASSFQDVPTCDSKTAWPLASSRPGIAWCTWITWSRTKRLRRRWLAY